MDDYLVRSLKHPCVYYDADFLTAEEGTQYYEHLFQKTAWETSSKINRWVALHEEPFETEEDGEANKGDARNYQYRDAPDALHNQKRLPFNDTLRALQGKAEAWYNSRHNNGDNNIDNDPVRFNVCLLNFYETGDQRIGWHSDREEVGRTTPIASISLGAPRDFMFRGKQDGAHDRATLNLGHGSLVIMENECQTHYVHCLPKQTDVTQGRINVTFRCKRPGEHTAGEEDHERRDQWLERIIKSRSSTSAGHDPLAKDTYVFGDGLFPTTRNGENDGDNSELEHLEHAVYTVRTNLGAEAYLAAEIMELLLHHDCADHWTVVPRPWNIPGYVAVCQKQPHQPTSDSETAPDVEQTDNSTTVAAILPLLLEIRSGFYVMTYHDWFDLSDVLSSSNDHSGDDIKSITGEDLYQFYKQRLVDGRATIPPFVAVTMGDNDNSQPVTFRVTCERIGGPHGFRAPEVEREIGGAMSEFYAPQVKPQMVDFDFNIRIDVVGTRLIVGTQHNMDDLSKRHLDGFRNCVSIKSNLAYIMLRCANLPNMSAGTGDEPLVLCDPFCGGGTIFWEALDMMRGHKRPLRCIGIDVSRKAAKGAAQNALDRNVGPDVCTIHCANQRAIQKLIPARSVDAIVTNLPWGIRTGNKVDDLQSMYEIFLRTSWYVLKDGARIVMIVLRGMQLTRIVRKLGGRYRLLRANIVRTSNNLPCIVVVEKLPIDEMNESIKGQLAYMSQYVNVSKELYHAIHMEKIAMD